MDDLLHLLHSDGADELRLNAGAPPVVVLDGEAQALEAPALTAETVEALWQSITDTRQRRVLRDFGTAEFVYRFRNRANFVVRARVVADQLSLEIY